MPRRTHKHDAAFSLAELSIVLIIIRLLVTSVVGGSKLILITKLKSVVDEARSFMTAQNIFLIEYSYLPGDIPNADSFWPSCVNFTSPNNCNGDGNGLIKDTERLRSWQHLALAELIPGSYDGGPTKTRAMTPEITTVPLSKYKTSYWRHITNTDYIITYAGTANNWAGTMTPLEAKHIDTKYDDGVHDSGKITAYAASPPRKGTGGTYPADSCYTTSSYTLTFNDNSCALTFRE